MSTNISLTEGNDWVIPVEFLDENNDPLDLTGLTFVASFAPSHNAPPKEFDVAQEGNVVTLSLPRTRTRNLGATRRLYWDIVAIANENDPELRQVTTYASGTINVKKGVTYYG